MEMIKERRDLNFHLIKDIIWKQTSLAIVFVWGFIGNLLDLLDLVSLKTNLESSTIIDFINDIPIVIWIIENWFWLLITHIFMSTIYGFYQQLIPFLEKPKPTLQVKKAYVDKIDVIITFTKFEEGDLLGLNFTTLSGVSNHLVYESTETIGGTSLYRSFPSDTRNEKYYFAHVKFINNPKNSSKEATAEKVWSEISFYDENFNVEYEGIKGRWGNTDQPRKPFPNEEMHKMLEVDFYPNQLDWELDIAMRHPSEKSGFVFNNDSYFFKEFRRGDMVLRKDKYIVKVVLHGIGLDSKASKFFFELLLGDDVTSPNFEEISQPKELKSPR